MSIPLFSTGLGPRPLHSLQTCLLITWGPQQASPGLPSPGLSLALHCSAEAPGKEHRGPCCQRWAATHRACSVPGQPCLPGHCQLGAQCLPSGAGHGAQTESSAKAAAGTVPELLGRRQGKKPIREGRCPGAPAPVPVSPACPAPVHTCPQDEPVLLDPRELPAGSCGAAWAGMWQHASATKPEGVLPQALEVGPQRGKAHH